MSTLTFHNLGLSFGDLDIFAGLTGEIPREAKIGLVGPNGIGKTSLLRILVGEYVASRGQVNIAKSTRIGYLQQEAVHAFVAREHTVYEEMLTIFSNLRAQESKLRQMEAKMAHGDVSEAMLERYGAAQEAFELAGGYTYELRTQQVLTGLGFKDEQQHLPLEHCSGGQKTRALLGRLLLEEPDLLILDEPTNHLDVNAVEWLEETLREWEGSLIIVSHDRYFLDRVVNVIWEMSINGLEVYRGNYSTYLQERDTRWAWRQEEFDRVQARFLKDLDFVKRNIIRDSTTDRAKGLLKRLIRQVKAVQVSGTQALNQSWSDFMRSGPGIAKTKWSLAQVEREIKALPRPTPGHLNFRVRIESGQRGGNLVLRTKDLEIGYPGTPLFKTNDIVLERKERAALIGPNGTGKTTFLRTLMGDIPPLAGDLRLGANLDIRYFAQAYQVVDLDNSVLDELQDHQPMRLSEARSYLARYQFRGDDVFKPMRALSGGERGRFALAVLSLQKANFLLLDEPTNHLDIPGQEALEAALKHFEGTILMVTHDRYLVDKLATQIWELRDGYLHVHEGNYRSYLASRREVRDRQAATAAKTVHRVPQSTRKQTLDVTRIETLIDELERALQQLGHDLSSATRAREWDQVKSLSRAYKDTQAELNVLMSQWERLV